MNAARIEIVIGTVLRTGVLISTVCLAAGLLLDLSGAWPAAAALLLQVGILVLLATPVARVIVSITQYISQRDWAFVTLTAVVLVELMASVVAALMFGRKL
jgi:uncharacterized membrane protein